MSLYRRACCRVSSSSPAESRCCVFCPIKCYIHTPIHLMSHVLDVEKQMDKRNVKHQPSRRYRVEAYTVYIARYAGMHDDNMITNKSDNNRWRFARSYTLTIDIYMRTRSVATSCDTYHHIIHTDEVRVCDGKQYRFYYPESGVNIIENRYHTLHNCEGCRVPGSVSIAMVLSQRLVRVRGTVLCRVRTSFLIMRGRYVCMLID